MKVALLREARTDVDNRAILVYKEIPEDGSLITYSLNVIPPLELATTDAVMALEGNEDSGYKIIKHNLNLNSQVRRILGSYIPDQGSLNPNDKKKLESILYPNGEVPIPVVEHKTSGQRLLVIPNLRIGPLELRLCVDLENGDRYIGGPITDLAKTAASGQPNNYELIGIKIKTRKEMEELCKETNEAIAEKIRTKRCVIQI